MKLLIGGSPCTYWSIAQTKNRETEASGTGWELFKNFLIARDKWGPDYFLYENNKSMSPAIRAQITKEFGFEPVMIDSALVSAQSRKRLYWLGRREPDGTYSRVNVELPEDRGIILRDILETGVAFREKAYAMLSTTGGATAEDMICRRQRNGAAEPINTTVNEKGFAVKAHYGRTGITEMLCGGGYFPATGCAEPVRIGTIENAANNPGQDSRQYRVYVPDGKSVTLCGAGGGIGAKTGLYAVQINAGKGGGQMSEKNICRETSCALYEYCGTLDKPVYKVKDGFITIKDKQYPIKLRDGCYIIRKLTVTECKRLQTVPEDYIFPVSDTQAYKLLGNGWTIEVIIWLLSHIPGITTEPLEVLSMYDGMSCGHIALDGLGAQIERYYATEIDKYAIQTTMHNYPETVELGDAFQVRDDNWKLERAKG